MEIGGDDIQLAIPFKVSNFQAERIARGVVVDRRIKRPIAAPEHHRNVVAYYIRRDEIIGSSTLGLSLRP